MCSRQEILFRQRSGEISIFEATDDTVDKPPSKQKLDPTRAVKKYRRSAAGTRKDQQYPPRTIGALIQTVDYLSDLFINWQQRPSLSIVELVNFLEDRIRAVQVDLVISQMASKQLQYKIVKFHILSMYLLSDTKTYERQHGKNALQTALSSYWNSGNQEVSETDDEILALTAIFELSEDLHCLERDPDGSHTFGAKIMAVYRKHFASSDTKSFPLFQWSLQMISFCNIGEWTNALQSINNIGGNFGVFVTCCLASSLSGMRAKALEAFNVSFMKGEKVADHDVARVLAMSDPSACRAFCSQLNLPVEEEMVSFKSAPIHMKWDCKKREDSLVFRRGASFASDRDNIPLPVKSVLSDLFK